MEDDILKDLDLDSDILTEVKTTPTNTGSGKGSKDNNLWNDTNIKPRNLKPEELHKPAMDYLIVIPNNREDLPTEAIELLTKVVTSLNGKGYTCRYGLQGQHNLYKALVAIEGVKLAGYLPWPKFNEDAVGLVAKRPNRLAYEVACSIVNDYNKKPAAIRALEASYAQQVLGMDCVDPVSFVLAWDPSGAEAITKDVDFSVIKSLSSYLRYTKKYDIPFINIGGGNGTTKLAEYLKSKAEAK